MRGSPVGSRSRPDRLVVVGDNRPARVVVPARQEAERVLLGMRGRSHPAACPAPGARVEAVARLFPPGAVTTLMGEQACESVVQLARSGKIKGFRYLHFASHGESDPRNAYRSALILSPDPDRSADPLAFDSDGTITAQQIARTWVLDADLVVLSACRTGWASPALRLSRLRPAAVRQGSPQPGAEPVEGRRRRHGAADDAVLPEPAGDACGPEVAPAQGRGGPRRRPRRGCEAAGARGSGHGPGRAF